MGKKQSSLLLIIFFLFVLLIGSYIVFPGQHYLLFSFLIIGTILFLFFRRFELKEVQGREIVLLSMLAAIGAVSRVPFAGLPSVQPTSFVIISAGYVFGRESGFLVGAAAAIVSNIFLGQGPWTPWQMFSWGLMGFSAGAFRRLHLMEKVWFQCAFGFVWGFLFGWIMNLWIIVGNIENFSFEFFLGIYIMSFSHDLAHALSNVFFIVLFSRKWVKILNRFKKKYGLLSENNESNL